MTQPADRISGRALNRATLARQGLLERFARSLPDVVEHLVGVQAQAPDPPYYALWSRVAHFRADELAARIDDKSMVRMALMRSTIHLVTARDALPLRAVVQPALDGPLRGSYGRALEGLDPARVAAEGRRLLADGALASSELGRRMAARFRGRDPQALANAVRAWMPMVQVPPRGLWGKSGPAVHLPADEWLGRPLDREPAAGAVETLVLRYLAAFGPASVMDAQKWSGLTRLAGVFDALRPRLTVLYDEDGRELFDLPGAPRPPADTVAPPRFLAEFDNLLIAYAHRTRVISDAHATRVMRGGMILGTVLVDGVVAGGWKLERKRSPATLRLERFRRLTRAERVAVESEGEALVAFAAPDAKGREIVWGG